ncbi:MAG: type I DNA topoisomerase [Flavobacteriales bacterium]|nr:type I DNA topoisomerase [Flavobacteriales bacterium]MCX7769352.1 type I DNA topoisomerase [Flavobacteriales bacterium]MDW8410717.1 type I DNA topoisomerase [Flavobacteriales bacterium]
MAKNLVIVESPAKAKTIESFLGKDFVVKSSFGHVRDLSEKGLSVEIENNFRPIYEISPDKKKVIEELKKQVQKASVVWLASDEDREGEAIAWHLYETLGLDKKDTRRIVFNEITPRAIKKAIESPRAIDMNLVMAQQARRVLDRLVGYEVSPILWKKVKPNLSAGRVQSVAVRLIVERERERENTPTESWFRLTAVFANEKGKKFKAELEEKIPTESEAEDLVRGLLGKTFFVESIEVKPARRAPSPPFTTSTLQQEASRRLGFSVTRTMRLAQQLYEEGKITYMRTDSVHLSEEALQSVEQYVCATFGKHYHKRRQYTTKAKGAQEAHEAIRPTDVAVREIEGDSALKKLYQLIWQRTVASQMADAELEKTRVVLGAEGYPKKLIAKGEVVRFDGFLKLYEAARDEDSDLSEEDDTQDQALPALQEGEILTLHSALSRQKFSPLPPRYTEATLVRKLEELGIGRPSTYAPIIQTIQQRGYVEKRDTPGVERPYVAIELKDGRVEKRELIEITGVEKGKLFPTDIGVVVNDFLMQHFPRIMDYSFTAEVEKEFDIIAEGKLEWTEMLRNFYGPFHQLVENTEKHSQKVKGRRFLGTDPKTGQNVYVLIGRYGPVAQIGDGEDGSKPRFAPLKKDWRLEAVTLEQALSLFELPKTLGVYQDQEVAVGVGRFGPFVRWGDKFVSLPKEADPHTISFEEALKLIEKKFSGKSANLIKEFDGSELRILQGPYGPYITDGKKNYRLPRTVEDPMNLTLEEVKAIITESSGKAGGSKKSRKKTKS